MKLCFARLREADDNMIIMFQRCYDHRPLWLVAFAGKKRLLDDIFSTPAAKCRDLDYLFLFLLSLLLPHTLVTRMILSLF